FIMEAYNVKNYQVTFASSIETSPGGEYGVYDIEAKVVSDQARICSEFRLMLQALLVERFKLQLHRVQKEMPVYVLSLEKDGSKFKESGSDDVQSARIGVNGRNQIITAFKQSTDDFAWMIENVFFLEHPM